jgi:hypothetical protein
MNLKFSNFSTVVVQNSYYHWRRFQLQFSLFRGRRLEVKMWYKYFYIGIYYFPWHWFGSISIFILQICPQIFFKKYNNVVLPLINHGLELYLLPILNWLIVKNNFIDYDCWYVRGGFFFFKKKIVMMFVFVFLGVFIFWIFFY